jgi:SAM-dependent methyltransferase
VPPDLEHFRKSQASALDPGWVCRDADAAATACRRAGEPGLSAGEFGEILFQCQHALAHFPQSGAPLHAELEYNITLIRTLRSWLERHEAPRDSPAQCALEIGCGPGAFLRTASPLFRAGALGMDLRISVLRLARRLADSGEAFIPFCTEGRRFEPIRISVPPDSGVGSGQLHFLQGDISAPPLDAEAFPAVIALSLLDTVPDPLFALGQMDALLAPRGLLLVGTPYSWDPQTTAPKEWWSQPATTGGEALRDALAGRNPVLPHLRYEVLAEADRMAWAVPGHGRLVYRFFLDVVLARKCG